MDYTDYVRVPFGVQACEVTEENFDDIFNLIGKEIKETPAGKKYILIDRRVIPNGHRAQVGGWVTIMDDKIRYYSKTAFAEQFTPKDDPNLMRKLEEMAYSVRADADLEETLAILEDVDAMNAIAEAESETYMVPDVAGRDV